MGLVVEMTSKKLLILSKTKLWAEVLHSLFCGGIVIAMLGLMVSSAQGASALHVSAIPPVDTVRYEAVSLAAPQHGVELPDGGASHRGGADHRGIPADAGAWKGMNLAVDSSIRNLLRVVADTSGGAGNIAVIYPESAEPFRTVFAQILEGIEDKAKSRAIRYMVSGNVNPQDIANDLRRQDARVVVALGRNGLKTAMALNGDFKIVAGGLLSVPEADARKLTLLSLAPAPSLLFDRLKAMMPEVSRVYVVFDPRNNGWLIRMARESARAAGLELVAEEATDLASALSRYQTILAAADPRRDAIWLPQDATTVDESTVLPLVLQESWTRGLAVFSSNLSHVKRGALFSLYPDTVQLGRNLAATALDTLSGGGGAQGQLPLRDVFLAVNLRTASHLGLRFSSRQQQGFNLTFPEP